MPEAFETTLLDEVCRTAQAFARVIEQTGGIAQEVATRVRTTCELVVRPPRELPLALAVVGDQPSARRALLDAAIGEKLLGADVKRDARVTIVRRSPAADYVAHTRNGRRVLRFSQRTPDRTQQLEDDLARALGALREATAAHQALRERLAAARASADAASSSLAESTHDLEAARTRAETTRGGLRAAEGTQAQSDALVTSIPPLPSYVVRPPPPWWAVWLWLMRAVFWLLWRGRIRRRASAEANATHARTALATVRETAGEAAEVLRAAEEKHALRMAEAQQARDAASALERAASDTRVRDEAEARVANLREERAKHDRERKRAFFEQVRALDAEDLAELAIDYPAAQLPEGVVLVDVPSPGTKDAERLARSTIRREAAALLLVTEVDSPRSTAVRSLVDELSTTMPLMRIVRARGGALVDDAGELFARIEAEKTLVVGVGAAMTMRGCVNDLSRARATAEESHRRRLETLEGQKIPDPERFRSGQMARVAAAIDQGADEVLQSATALLHDSMAALGTEWSRPVAAATSRGAVEATVKSMNETAGARIEAVLERVSEHVALELQKVAESLETWVLEEIHSRYQVARRLGVEELAPVISEVTREDLQREMAGSPAASALDAFEKERVGYGLGGAATGALLGTLIFPGIGTAIGAFVGVFAGFFKSIDSLKQDCLTRIQSMLAEAEQHAVTQLRGKRADLARVIGLSVEEALREAFERQGDAIGRLMSLERRAIEREKATLAALDEARNTLLEHEKRLAQLIDRALERLGPQTASQSGSEAALG